MYVAKTESGCSDTYAEKKSTEMTASVYTAQRGPSRARD